MSADPAIVERFRENLDRIVQAVPFLSSLGFQFVDVDDTTIYGRQPYSEALVGDPASGVIAGGVITTILDSVGGFSCALKLGNFLSVATLDLRIDYMRPSTPREDIFAQATCYHATRSVCFVRALAHNGDMEKPIATAAGAFAITKREAS